MRREVDAAGLEVHRQILGLVVHEDVAVALWDEFYVMGY
jgi:hypothetical protein